MRVKSAARLVTAAKVFQENPPKRFKRAESCLPGTQSFVGHSAPCQLGAFAGKGPRQASSCCASITCAIIGRRGACKSLHVAQTDGRAPDHVRFLESIFQDPCPTLNGDRPPGKGGLYPEK